MTMTSKPIFLGAVLAALMSFAMLETTARALDICSISIGLEGCPASPGITDPNYGCWASESLQACEASGGRGDDHLYGGKGNDTLDGGWGDDHLYGGKGKDTLYGSWGDDHLYGGRGRDTLYGSWGDDHLYGGSGRDTLYGSWGDDHLYGGGGRDTLYGSWGNDYLAGGKGRDTLYGGWDDDWLVGGPGNDHLMGNWGSDFMAGGDGSDTYDLSGAGGSTGICMIGNDPCVFTDRDVILADDDDNIPSQFNDLKPVDISDVIMPSIEVSGHTYTLDADSLADFAHRVKGADIVYRAED